MIVYDYDSHNDVGDAPWSATPTRSSFSVTPLAPSTLAGRTEASAGSRSNQRVSFRRLEAPMEGMNLGPKVWQKWMSFLSFLFQGFGRLKTMGDFVLLFS